MKHARPSAASSSVSAYGSNTGHLDRAKKPNAYSTMNAAAQNHMAAELVQQI
jgi:hypothetical protein